MYPAVEYDFLPNRLSIQTTDYVHIQWTGSNTHNNGNPASDGQAGDDGQGKTGTDRHNFVQINHLNENYPLPFEMSTLWKDIEIIGILNEAISTNDNGKYLKFFNSDDSSKDLALYFSSSGYYHCVKKQSCDSKSYESTKPVVDSNLNNSPASVPGALIRFKSANKEYKYMCSRNNNFSNRSQKGSIRVG